MKHRRVMVAIGLLTAFVALTAIGGGITMLTGIEQFPPEWLRDTPFNDYTIPALVLAIVVGGSSLLAVVMLLMKHKGGIPASALAGILMAGYIVVEVAILKQEPPGPTWTEGVYFGIGMVISGLAVYVYLAENHSPHMLGGR